MAENDPNFKVHIDEGDDKDSPRDFDDKATEPDIHRQSNYPEINTKTLYESHQAPLP